MKKNTYIVAVVTGLPLSLCSMEGMYNQSASYALEKGLDVYVKPHFLYWSFQQETVNLANLVEPDAINAGMFTYTGNGSILLYEPSYQPGFAIDLGFDLRGVDSWAFLMHYTWYKNSSSQSQSAGDNQYLILSPSILQVTKTLGDSILLARSFDFQEDLHYNSLDMGLTRSFYLGRKLAMDFGLALRGLWMQEESLLTAKGLSFLQRNRAGPQELTGVLYAKDKQASWAIGPQMGLYSRWLLGYGFEVLGNAVTSLLYSRYTTWSSSLAGPITNQIVADLETTPQGDPEVLKPVLETFLGIRWGSYFKNHRYHGNLSIGYDFNIYWNQNLSSVFPDKSADMGNFYLQGLNVAAGVQF